MLTLLLAEDVLLGCIVMGSVSRVMLQYIYQLKSPQVFIVEILGKGLWLEAEMSLASISVGRIVI